MWLSWYVYERLSELSTIILKYFSIASNEDLTTWSGEIGSDISFFFSSGTAYCTGRGEIVNSIPPLPQSDEVEVHVFKPKEGLSTALVFKSLNLSTNSKISPESILSSFSKHGVLTAAAEGMLINDLEKPAFSNAPILADIKRKIEVVLSKSDSGVMMSGSGTSIFAICRKNSKFNSQINDLLSAFPTLSHYKCHFINRTDNKAWYN